MPSKPAFDTGMREVIIESMAAAKVPHKENGTIVTIEGPRFSSLAESRIFSKVYEADVINMTTCPEGKKKSKPRVSAGLRGPKAKNLLKCRKSSRVTYAD